MGWKASFNFNLMGFTLWSFNIAIENGPLIADLPIKNGDFPVCKL
jgi:hypothetical protein